MRSSGSMRSPMRPSMASTSIVHAHEGRLGPRTTWGRRHLSHRSAGVSRRGDHGPSTPRLTVATALLVGLLVLVVDQPTEQSDGVSFSCLVSAMMVWYVPAPNP